MDLNYPNQHSREKRVECELLYAGVHLGKTSVLKIESMACGTPVVAYAGGSVAEVMDDGVTGFVVNDIEQAVEVARRVRNLSRARCREVFEKRFTAKRMANDYINAYTRLADSRMRRTEQSLESSMRSFQSALAG